MLCWHNCGECWCGVSLSTDEQQVVSSTANQARVLISGPPGSSASSDSALDAQQKLVAALAKAALGQVNLLCYTWAFT